MPPRLVLSDEVRASLAAVRVAQEAARVRARRQTVQTRFWFATSVAAAAAIAFAFAPRVARWRHGRAQPPVVAHAVAQAAPLASPAPRALLASAAPKAYEAPPAVAAQPAGAAVPTQPEPAREAGGTDRACDTALIRSAPWRLSAEACARAFEADPDNAALALAVAQATHARGHLADAALWARRALALDANAAEAYVLIARAEMKDDHAEEARAAYEHYLQLAPRGWHKAEARSALERLR
ncbi:MAG TPA: hypothetical protein VIF57_22140 [Polyangia bacterium]